jgi:hypothetical protein
MIGFDGEPGRTADLRAALAGLLAVFPEHLAKTRAPAPFEADEMAQNELFDAILRAHRRDRLALPVQALRAAGAAHHGFDRMHLRRLAWFVPSLLASWLDRAPGPGDAPFGVGDLEAILGGANVDDDEGWTDDEAAALEAFFTAALDAALATPLGPARTTGAERPREDGVRVWSLHSPSAPLEVLRAARALGVPLESLVVRWALDPAPLALDHLLEAVYDTTMPSKRYLAHEAVADRLGEAFFEASGERALRLSKAEATVRRNIKRRGGELEDD